MTMTERLHIHSQIEAADRQHRAEYRRGEMTMTSQEKIRYIDEHQEIAYGGYELAEKVRELRSGITLDDLFAYKGTDVISEMWAYRILGWRTVYGCRINDEIEQAHRAGRIRSVTRRERGCMVTWLVKA